MAALEERKQRDVTGEGYTEDFNRIGRIPFLKRGGRYNIILGDFPFVPLHPFSTLLNLVLCPLRLTCMLRCRSMGSLSL